jgi:cytochrome c2
MRTPLFFLIGAVLCVVVIAVTIPAAGQVKVMPGSVVRGEGILENKGCLDCHGLKGRGGSRAPDFSQLAGQNKPPALLATEMWNHMPKMWSDFQALQRQVPVLTSSESADLFAFFYATLYFAPKGNNARGRTLFGDKGCDNCHSEILDARRTSALTQDWRQLNDPIAWAERMWNHASEMDAATSNRGIDWPRLSERDMADLVIFLSGVADAGESATDFTVGDPERGRNVFEGSCESCHSFGEGKGAKVDLLGRPSPSSMVGYMAAMWNHAPLMRRRGGSTVKLSVGEMRDVVAFLFAQYYFFDQGDSARGRKVFEAKQCASCHENRPAKNGAPDLTQSAEMYSPITLTSAAWQHGPTMLARMKQQGISWPEFKNSEMRDLIAFLNSRLVHRIGNLGRN